MALNLGFPNRWDRLRQFPTDYTDRDTGKSHESLLRSYQVLREVKYMLERGDSAETVLVLIQWAYEGKPSSPGGA